MFYHFLLWFGLGWLLVSVANKRKGSGAFAANPVDTLSVRQEKVMGNEFEFKWEKTGGDYVARVREVGGSYIGWISKHYAMPGVVRIEAVPYNPDAEGEEIAVPSRAFVPSVREGIEFILRYRDIQREDPRAQVVFLGYKDVMTGHYFEKVRRQRKLHLRRKPTQRSLRSQPEGQLVERQPVRKAKRKR